MPDRLGAAGPGARLAASGRLEEVGTRECRACGASNYHHFIAAATEVAKHLAVYTCRLIDAERGSA